MIRMFKLLQCIQIAFGTKQKKNERKKNVNYSINEYIVDVVTVIEQTHEWKLEQNYK